MDIRKSAADLSDAERDQFLEALIRLKQRQGQGVPLAVGVYDRYVALHQAVFAVVAPGLPPGETVNFGHWNIGFCPWHRQYLRAFEQALQAEVPGVTLPYWDWAGHPAALARLFTPEFLSELRDGAPAPLQNGVLRATVPTAERPPWWPDGAEGFAVHGLLTGGWGETLQRGSQGVPWPPSAAALQDLENYLGPAPDEVHPLWFFWSVLEQGSLQITRATHNRGHNFIGGHMATGYSPNDPVFWLHHANVDRLWANWQANRLDAVPGSQPEDHWPDPEERSPFDGEPAPLGHRLNDAMWPWVAGAPGYGSASVSPPVAAILPDFSAAPVVTVKDVLSTEDMGYQYAAPND